MEKVKTAVYVTPEQKRKIKEAAAKEGVTYSTFCAQAAYNKAKRK